MNVVITERFAKDLEAIRLEKVRQAAIEIIEKVSDAENIQSIPNLKKMKGFTTAYRIRSGRYRIGIYIEGNTVEFIRFAARKDIYDMFP